MKWIKKLLLVAPLMLLLISGTAYAKNNVSEIDISVTVRDDGSAYVVQNWQGTFGIFFIQSLRISSVYCAVTAV